MGSHSQLRITKEITNIQRSEDLSLAVSFAEDNLRSCKALIIGPPDTPYEFGFFEFEVIFGKDYPTVAPSVRAVTTNGGRTRFNPNIYADGKVCLSILGTWRGEPGEQWSSAQGLESILISIQSLMSPNPYENEPGFETMTRPRDKEDAELYAHKIRHESLRISVIERLEDYLGIVPHSKHHRTSASHQNSTHTATKNANQQSSKNGLEHDEQETEDEASRWPFADLCKRRFLWYFSSYLKAIDDNINRTSTQEGSKFPKMAFEHSGNVMEGMYEYEILRERLQEIHAALSRETLALEAQGVECAKNESPDAFAFKNRLKHLKDSLKKSASNVDLDGSDENPFIWRLTIFGQPTTLIEGGIFTIKIVIPVDFPVRQPRVTVETPMFHQRVAADGTLCYFPKSSQDIDSHVHGIITAIESEDPRYDPRTLVHPEASRLLWGSEADKKSYRRQLRRSAERSSEM